MKHIGNIQFLSPGKSRKAALWGSIVVMLLFWTLITVVLASIFINGFVYRFSFDIPNVTFIAVMLLIDVWFIPLQLIRYFRQLQALR